MWICSACLLYTSIFVDTSNQVFENRQQWGATMYQVPTPKGASTSLNANGTAYTGAFKICIPVSYTHLDVYKRQVY